jgi:hypothetical protein
MVVPMAARYAVAAVGVLLVATAYSSMIGTLIVPRSVASWLTRWVDRFVDGIFMLLTHSIGSRLPTQTIKDYRRRDRILAAQAATLLVCQLVAWLGMFFLGFSLIFWPLLHAGITDAFDMAGTGLWAIGSATAHGALEETILDIVSITGLITVALQIAYLPTLYSAFNRRETEVALLAGRGGVPAWGPELLARTHYALGTGVSTLDTLPDLYQSWERWAADVAESHTTYLPLTRFRSPRAGSSWVTALLSVLDSAALFLALSPDRAPVVPARLCLRGGWTCFSEIAAAMGLSIPGEPDVSSGISLTYEQFLDAVAVMRKVDFPIERHPRDAWPDFVGWRVNYERAAYAIARKLDVVPAMWSGPRRRPGPEIPPVRPGRGRPPRKAGKSAGGGQLVSSQQPSGEHRVSESEDPEQRGGAASDGQD